MANKAKVLVLGDDNRSCLAIVRSLGRQQISTWVGTQTPDSIVPYSRYVAGTIRMSSTKTNIDVWLAETQALLKQEPIDLVVPSADSTLVPLVQHRKVFEPLARLAIPHDVGFEHSYFKNKTLALARQLGVPIPTTVLVESIGDLAHIQSHPELQFPLIVKPVSSKVWKNGKRFDLQVRLAHEQPSLVRIVSELLYITPVLIQNYFHGVGIGQEFLAHEGAILSAFQHERVHEPLDGGGSSYRKSVPFDEQILDYSRRMLSYLRWTGVAMVEYKRNPATEKFVLMEINGRFWGSLPLAIAAGVDFPYHVYQLLVKEQLPTSDSYKVGLYCRNITKDLGWFRECLRVNPNSLSLLFGLVRQMGGGLRNVLLGRERWDTITFDDPLPGLVEIWSAVGTLVRQFVDRIEKGLFAVLASTAVWRRMQRMRLHGLLDANPHLLFLCRGNICRSPFAEAYARLRLDTLGVRGIQLGSAGTYPLENRESPELAQLISQEFGVSLNCHRSRLLDHQLVKWASAIVCMDFGEYRELLRRFPEAKAKAFFLRAFDSTAKDVQVADPWGKTGEEFRLCFKQISSSTEKLIQSLFDR